MNIFIDTSVIFKDPFWKGNFFSELIEIVREKEVGLFISDVVLLEIERNYGRIVEQEIANLEKINKQIKHYQIKIDKPTTADKQSSIDGLNAHYKCLEKEGILKIINYSNDILPEIVDRAIKKRKPFSEKKTELKDAIIWLSYSSYAEINKLEDCVFLTDNVSDFCDSNKIKENIFEIHPELQKDSSRFRVYKSPKELIQAESSTFQFISQRFGAWLKKQVFDSDFVLEILQTLFYDEISTEISNEYDNYELGDIFNDDFFLTGYVSAGYVEVNHVDNIQIDTFNEECIISGEIFAYCDIEGYVYNAVRDRGEDRHSYFGELTNMVGLTFSFYYDQSEVARSINLDDFKIVE